MNIIKTLFHKYLFYLTNHVKNQRQNHYQNIVSQLLTKDPFFYTEDLAENIAKKLIKENSSIACNSFHESDEIYMKEEKVNSYGKEYHSLKDFSFLVLTTSPSSSNNFEANIKSTLEKIYNKKINDKDDITFIKINDLSSLIHVITKIFENKQHKYLCINVFINGILTQNTIVLSNGTSISLLDLKTKINDLIKNSALPISIDIIHYMLDNINITSLSNCPINAIQNEDNINITSLSNCSINAIQNEALIFPKNTFL